LHIWSRKKFLLPKFAIELDIRRCFDTISHEFIINNVGTLQVGQQSIKVINRHLLREWLQSGFIDILGFFSPKDQVMLTESGIPQGGPISPCIANLVLTGIEHTVKSVCTKTNEFTDIHIKLEDKMIWCLDGRELLCTLGLDDTNFNHIA